MSSLSFTRDLSTEGGLLKSGTFSIDGISNPVPGKAIPIQKLTDEDRIYEYTRGLNEVYQQVDAQKLEASMNGDDPPFLDYLSQKLRHANDDEIAFAFLGYTDTHEIGAAEAREMVRILDEYSDVITAPLQPALVRALMGDQRESDDPVEDPLREYRTGVEHFVEAASDLDTEKPLMGMLPLASDGLINELLQIYEDFGAEIVGVNFNGKRPTAQAHAPKVRQLVGRIAALRIFEERLLYAINVPKLRYRAGETIRDAVNFAPVGMGFDVVGVNHVGRGVNMDGEQSNFNVFDGDVAGYRPIPVDSVTEAWPVTIDSRINPERIENVTIDKANELVGLINAEQLARCFSELRDRLEEGNERNFLTGKAGLTDDMTAVFESTRNAYVDGSGTGLDEFVP